jgi:hypothetical protein
MMARLKRQADEILTIQGRPIFPTPAVVWSAVAPPSAVILSLNHFPIITVEGTGAPFDADHALTCISSIAGDFMDGDANP